MAGSVLCYDAKLQCAPCELHRGMSNISRKVCAFVSLPPCVCATHQTPVPSRLQQMHQLHSSAKSIAAAMRWPHLRHARPCLKQCGHISRQDGVVRHVDFSFAAMHLRRRSGVFHYKPCMKSCQYACIVAWCTKCLLHCRPQLFIVSAA
jgi:hypothetical protein